MGIAGNGKADEWAKIAAEEPDTPIERECGRWPSHGRSLTSSGRSRRRSRWKRASGLEAGLQDEVLDAEKPEAGCTVAGSSKRLASWFYQLKTGHCLSG